MNGLRRNDAKSRLLYWYQNHFNSPANIVSAPFYFLLSSIVVSPIRQSFQLIKTIDKYNRLYLVITASKGNGKPYATKPE